MSQKVSFLSPWRTATIAGVEVKTQGVPLSIAVKLNKAATDEVSLVLSLSESLRDFIVCADDSPLPEEGLTVDVLKELLAFAMGKGTESPL